MLDYTQGFYIFTIDTKCLHGNMYVLDIGNKIRTKAYIFFRILFSAPSTAAIWGHAKIASNFKKGEKPRELKFTSSKCVTSTVFRVYVRIFVKFATI